jgi:arsenite-transporting ATPase
MRDLLSDPKTSSVRLVVNAERMVIREAQRTFTYLNLYGYPTDLVICNRLIPKHVEHSYFTSWKRSQGRHYRTIEESFSPLPVRAVPLFCQEVRGISMLRAMAEALYGDEDPTQVYYQGLVQAVHKADGHYVLTLKLPFTTKENVSLSRNGDELLIQAGRYRRNLLLPHSLLHLPIDSAKLEEGRLKITFVKDAKSAKKEHPRR